MNDERAERLRKTLNFPERNVARIVRQYRAEDLAALQRMHASQGFDYPLPDIDDPLFVTKVVLEDGDGKPVMAALGRLTCEAYLLADRGAGTPREKFQRLLILEREALADAESRGLADAHCWLPPGIARRFGQRLENLGWVRDDAWIPYCKRMRS